ncbi:MAG: hypothetical protein LBF82_02970 [Lactobacillales bacterium]|nr:hypothetical protein [Lactobacillales bacterium]
MKLGKKKIFSLLCVLGLISLFSVQAFADSVPVVDISDDDSYALEKKKTAKPVIGTVQVKPIGPGPRLLRGARGGPTYYSQKDPQWSGAVFGGYTFGGTGCVPTSIAMVMGGTPLEWGQDLYDAHFYDGGAGGNAIIYAGKKVHRTIKPIYSYSKLRELLESGWAVIALCNPPISPAGFTHAVVTYGLHGDMTNVLDPLANRVSGDHLVQEIWDARSLDPANLGDEDTSLYGVSGSFSDEGTLPVFRLFNPIGDRHLLTTNSNERDDLVSRGWRDETVAFQVLTEGVPIYRVYDRNSGEHLYTANSNERDFLVTKGWDDEGVAFYVLGLGFAEGEGIPVYRMRNPRNGEHLYTTNFNEVLKATAEYGWEDEGIAWYN